VDPKHHGRLDEGIQAVDAGEFGEAAAIFEEAVLDDGTDARAWYYLGLSYLELRRPDDAQEALRRALALDPAHADSCLLLGHALGSTGDIDGAADAYREALRVEPGHTAAQRFLDSTASLISSREHLRDAVKLMNQKPRPDGWESRAFRQLLLSVAEYTHSPARRELGALAKLMREKATTVELRLTFDPALKPWAEHCAQGLAALASCDWASAIASYRHGLELRSEDAFVHAALGFAFAGLGDDDAAIEAWMQAYRLDPTQDFAMRTSVVLA